MPKRNSQTFVKDESGSLSVLMSGLFLIMLLLSIGIIDITDSFLAKRELIQIGEDAILMAAHSLDEERYYQNSLPNPGLAGGRVPIDCAAAASKFRGEILLQSLRGNTISVSGWRCVNDQINASVTSQITAIVSFPLLSSIAGGDIKINATIGAMSDRTDN
ncbi:MAG: hypothetical protein HQ476_01560 [SAR202 cluster bacterium]|nr:hypothetical protein [SAR202 cluster bacterium]